MALGDLYVDPEDLKTRLEIDNDEAMGRLVGAVHAACRGVETFCSRQFNDAGTVSARVFRATSCELVSVDDFSTTAGLVVKTDEDDDGVYETTWPAADYEVSPLNGIVDGVPGWPYWTIRAVRGRRFPTRQRASVQVTSRWGWAVVPTPVTESSNIAAEEIFKLKETPFGIGGYGDFGVIRVRNNPFTSRMLAPYQRGTVQVA